MDHKKEKPLNSKGAAIFKVMLEDQRLVREHLKNGGKLEDILKEVKRRHELLSI